MKKIAVVLFAFVLVMLIAPAAFAQGTAPDKAPINPSYLAIAAGFGIGIAAFGGALGQGKIAGAACEGMARNPGAAGAVRAAMILGLVFVETLSLFTFVVAILLYLKM
ncbi:MAG TPA: ATP synthase F0 subunit C [Candidatus Dormibacteraeota bacterium]|jgi:F-type H+-transporting ATPase subunit c|nr:ATP synthase F0 subunit C [Candidatus Dormibacteraeota bacterium]